MLKARVPPARVGRLAQGRGWSTAHLVRWVKVLARRGLPSLYRLYVRRRTAEEP
jgi:hypothetical protein